MTGLFIPPLADQTLFQLKVKRLTIPDDEDDRFNDEDKDKCTDKEIFKDTDNDNRL